MVEPSATVLHIEDNEANRYVVRRVLQNAGFRVVEATSGEGGLKAVVEHQPDLIVLDVRLPGMNGFEVCRQIKSNPETAFIPVLHLSASFVKSQDKVHGLDSGADAYLAQPVEPIELVATVRSLLRIRRAEEAALSLAREWQTTFDSISDGICLLDHEGRVLRCNTALLALLGKPLDEMIGQVYSDLLNRALGLNSGECFRRTKQTRHRQSMEIHAGSQWFLKTIDPVFDERGTLTGAVFILSNITERKRIEQEHALLLMLEQEARAASETANRVKDEFLATLSHELRSPLNAMLGWLRLLNTRQFDEETTKRALETIERNAKAQAQLVEDLLDVSRIIQGKLRLNVRPTRLDQVIEAALDTVRPSAEAKDIRLNLMLDPDASQIVGDADRLQQVVWNLLANAVKFTPQGGQVNIQLQRTETRRSEGTLQLAVPCIQILVADTGQGIKPEFVPFVFDRFRQADSSTTRSYSGLGLGLAIVRHLVELHGGTVSASSPGLGQGATFTVELPLIPTRPAPEPLHPRRIATEPAVSEDGTPNLSGIRVLIVDDEADTRDFLVAALASYGAIPIATASVNEAIATLSKSNADVLVSDISMPGSDGYSLIHYIRSLSIRDSVIPAVALTAYARPEDRARALAAGFHVHLAKPIEPAQLAAVVAHLLQRTSS